MADYAASTGIRERRNWLIHLHYVRNEVKECLELIEEQLRESQGLCEYAIFVKALIQRHQGNLQDSLTLFQAAALLNPQSAENLKQVGRSLYLLGRHKNAIEMYEEARRHADEDWEVPHSIGLCYMYLKMNDKAEESFQKANIIQRHDCTFLQLGKLYTGQERYQEAVDVYLEALEFSPGNPELLSTVGLLYLRLGESSKAFEYLGNALTHDPKHGKAILAAGSVIQDSGDYDVALSKYRIAIVTSPNSAPLWSNIGMCFFGKKNYIAAVSCLKKALALSPFEWKISHNLGLVFLHSEQYASAFHYLSASINLNPNFARSYMNMAIALHRLDDFDNACAAYEKALSLESDFLCALNFSVMLFNHGDTAAAKKQYSVFETAWRQADDEARRADPSVLQTAELLATALA